MLAFASPRLFAIPPTVRRYVLPLKRSATSSSATSSLERRRRIGSGGASVSPFSRREPEQVAETAAAALAVARDDRRRRRAFLQPAVLDGDLLAERADVDELRAFLGRVANGALAHQERALADRADPHRADLGHPHAPTIAPRLRALA